MEDSLILDVGLVIPYVQNQGIFHSRTRLRYLAPNFFLTSSPYSHNHGLPRFTKYCYLNLSTLSTLSNHRQSAVCHQRTAPGAWIGHYSSPLTSGNRGETYGAQLCSQRFLTWPGVGVASLRPLCQSVTSCGSSRGQRQERPSSP